LQSHARHGTRGGAELQSRHEANVLDAAAGLAGDSDGCERLVRFSLRPANQSIAKFGRGHEKVGGDLDAAERDYRAALTLDPGYGKAWQNLALVFARRGDYQLAVATLARVVSKHVAANDVGYIAMLSGDYAAAEQLFADALRLSPRYYQTADENFAELRRRRAAVAAAAP